MYRASLLWLSINFTIDVSTFRQISCPYAWEIFERVFGGARCWQNRDHHKAYKEGKRLRPGLTQWVLSFTVTRMGRCFAGSLLSRGLRGGINPFASRLPPLPGPKPPSCFRVSSVTSSGIRWMPLLIGMKHACYAGKPGVKGRCYEAMTNSRDHVAMNK